MENFSSARENMVKGQILPNKITNKELIKTILAVPRHFFIPEHYKALAYSDEIISLNNYRYLIPPMILAKMLQAVELKENDIVLDVACGSGYSSAVISSLAKKVVALESDPELASKANFTLNKIDIGNVIVLNGKLSEGHADGAPYDVIFLNGAISIKPHDLLGQLSDNGRLTAIINGEIIIFSKKNGEIIEESIFDISLPLIEDFDKICSYKN